VESHYSSSRAEATGLARTKSPERQRVTRHHSEPREIDILMNTIHFENPAQKLTREPWSRLPPDAGKGGATETAANMRGANRLQPGADRSDYEGVNAFVYVEQWPESGVSRSGKRRRRSFPAESPTHGGQHCRVPLQLIAVASDSTLWMPFSRRRWNGCGSNGSFPATGMLLTRHPPWYLPAHRAGPGPGQRLKCFPAFHDSHVRADNRPNGSEAVKEILTREEDKNDEIYLHQK